MSELQTAITNLQLKHSELVAAVKSYPGTVASEANAAFGKASVEQRKVRDTVRDLRKRIEDDGQSLILDWEHDVAVVNGEGKLLSEEVEFSRSTGGGRFGPDGKYEWVEAGVPRIDYDPETGECRGLLVEEQRTNHVPHSLPLAWERVGSVSVSSYPYPAGGALDTVAVISASNDGDYIWISSGLDTHSRQVLTFLVRFPTSGAAEMVKLGGRRDPNFYRRFGVELSPTGELERSSEDPNYSLAKYTVKPRADQWWEVTIHVEHATHIPTDNVTISPINGSIEILYVGREVGTFPTSYIPTDGSVVTRARDRASVPIADWFNRSEGSLSVDLEIRGTGVNNYVISDGQGLRWLYHNSALHLKYYDGKNNADFGSAPDPSRVRFTIAATPGELRYIRGGVPRSRPHNGNLLSKTNRFDLFGRAAGHIKHLEYFPRALTETELQELTSL